MLILTNKALPALSTGFLPVTLLCCSGCDSVGGLEELLLTNTQFIVLRIVQVKETVLIQIFGNKKKTSFYNYSSRQNNKEQKTFSDDRYC